MKTPTPQMGHYNNLPLLRFDSKTLKIEGFSRGGMQTYWRIRECDLLLDIGSCHWDLAGSRYAAITHTHPDHFAGLIGYIATREMMHYEIPTIFAPPFVVSSIEILLKAWRDISGDDYPCHLVEVEIGTKHQIKKDYFIEAVEADHTVDAVGYVIWNKRTQLLPELVGMPSEDIKKLVSQGQKINTTRLVAELAYTGDSRPAIIENNPIFGKAEVLISECTFVDTEVDPGTAHKHGHTHLEDIIRLSDTLENQNLILSHFSTRWPRDKILELLNKKLPKALLPRTVAWI